MFFFENPSFNAQNHHFCPKNVDFSSKNHVLCVKIRHFYIKKNRQQCSDARVLAKKWSTKIDIILRSQNMYYGFAVKLRSRIGVHGISNFFRNFPLFFPKNIDFLQIFWEKCMKTCKNCQNPRKNRKFSKKIGIF